jgi:hypothetical protein
MTLSVFAEDNAKLAVDNYSHPTSKTTPNTLLLFLRAANFPALSQISLNRFLRRSREENYAQSNHQAPASKDSSIDRNPKRQCPNLASKSVNRRSRDDRESARDSF